MIPYGRQSIDDRDIAAVTQVLRSDWLTQGPVTPLFEQAVAQKVGVEHAVAVNSATSALHIACLALGLGPGDRLWTSPNSFVASANCGLYCGASVDFVDIDPRTYNMCVLALAKKFESAEREGTLPKILVPVHFAGQSCDMVEIHKLARRYGCKILEDASHAIGGSFNGTAIGSCQFSDITVFSFHPVKIITTAEGGMALTRNADLARRMQRLRTHGITRDPEQCAEVPPGPWYYEQLELGFNYRLTDLQSALGLSQMSRIEPFISRRQELAQAYDLALMNLPVILPFQGKDSLSAWHLYVIQIDPAKTSITRDVVFARMRAAGIGVNVHYIPIHTQPYYRRLGFHEGQFPVAESYYGRALSLPMYPDLTSAQQATVVSSLARALEG